MTSRLLFSELEPNPQRLSHVERDGIRSGGMKLATRCPLLRRDVHDGWRILESRKTDRLYPKVSHAGIVAIALE
jgi:hypothetical protein